MVLLYEPPVTRAKPCHIDKKGCAFRRNKGALLLPVVKSFSSIARNEDAGRVVQRFMDGSGHGLGTLPDTERPV